MKDLKHIAVKTIDVRATCGSMRDNCITENEAKTIIEDLGYTMSDELLERLSTISLKR